MKHLRHMVWLTSVSLCLLTTPGMAQDHGPPPNKSNTMRPDKPFKHPHHPRRGGPLLDLHADELGIDDATMVHIKAITEASRERLDTLHESLKSAREHMHALLESDFPDEDEVMMQADVISAISNELHKERLKTMLQVRAYLNPEQRAQLKELRERYAPPHKRWKKAP
ncbi:MAG: Spy/CpxP family protein refolding chaperone [Myxococcota bacterium]